MEYRVHSISWNITQRCNLNCSHCYLDADFRLGRRTDELTREDCNQVVDQIASVNPNALLILTGGEPLLRKDLCDIARYATGKGFTVVIGTNGTPLNDDIAARLMDSGVKGASISLHSLRPDAHDGFTRVPGSWQGAIRGAELLKREGLEFIIQTSVMGWNFGEVPEIIDFAYELGARAANIYFLICTGRGQDLTDLSVPDYERMLSCLYGIQKSYQGKMLIGAKCAPQYKRIVYEEDPSSPFLRTYSGGCPAATHYCRITPKGDLTPCPYMPLSGGNLREKSFAEIWRHAPLMQELRNRELLQGRCGGCELQNICGGCRARAYAQTGSYLGEDPSCGYRPGKYGAQPVILQEGLTFGLEAEFQSSWSDEARNRLSKIPSFARGMVIKSVERFASERRYPVITPDVMKEAREKLVGAFGGMPPLGANTDRWKLDQK
jgi:radical SAM protein with 4Fe4S-binding SPASM domain